MADNRLNQSIAEGLVHSGMTDIGNIGSDFRSEGDNAARRASVKQAADATVAAMRTRFYQKEYEQLTDLYVKPAMERMNKVQAEFVTGTTPAVRTLARSASQEELQAAANAAQKAAPGPQKDAKEAGPAAAGLETASPAGLGAVQTWEAESYIDPSTGEPVDANDPASADVIRQYQTIASQAYQQEFMGLMDNLAKYPNNPFASQAIGQMMKNLTDQMSFAATGRKDRQEAEEHMSQMQLNEAEYQQMSAGAEAQELSNTGVKELRAAAPVLREAAYLSDMVPELYQGFDDEYFKNPKAKDVPTLRALNARARTTAEKMVDLEMKHKTKQRELKKRVLPDTEPITWPQQYRQTDEYKDAFERAVGPVMGDIRNKWSSSEKFRNQVVSELGVGAHLAKINDATDDQVAALLTQYAVKEHPERANEAEAAAFAQIYSLDADHREAVDNEMATQRQRWVEMGQVGVAETFDEVLTGPTDPAYPNEKFDMMHMVIKMQDPTLDGEQRQWLWNNSGLRRRKVAKEKADAYQAAARQEEINRAAADEMVERYGNFDAADAEVEERVSQPTDNIEPLTVSAERRRLQSLAGERLMGAVERAVPKVRSATRAAGRAASNVVSAPRRLKEERASGERPGHYKNVLTEGLDWLINPPPVDERSKLETFIHGNIKKETISPKETKKAADKELIKLEEQARKSLGFGSVR